MKELFRRGFLLFLSLALLICCTGCAPESAEETGSLSSFSEEGKALFQLDPESVEYIKLCDSSGYTILELEGKEDIQKIVSVFNDFRYHSIVEVPNDPEMRENIRSYPVEYSIGFRDAQGRCYACEFAQCGEIRLHHTPMAGTMTVYVSDQAGYFDEIIAYLPDSSQPE